ncbi:MAG: peptidylprolyl isomerase [Bacteroidales bacterium]|nr:peptidylprolyl isomerase [Bacteroidales bacterium]
MNRLFRTLMLAALLCLPLLPARAQKYTDGLVDKSVAVIGNDMIMLSQLESEVQMMRMRGQAADQKARCEILENMLINKLFYVQAKKDSLQVNDANVEQVLTQRLDEAFSALGGEKGVTEYFHKPLYKLRMEWKEQLTEQSLIQQKQQEVATKTARVTPADVADYFHATAKEDLPVISTQYRLRQILVYPDRESANLAVKEKLLSLRERVLNGEKFSTLARMYSQDPGSVSKGGELGMLSKTVFWPAFSDAAMALKVGQVSQIVETPDGFHIIQLIAREGDMFNARHILIKPTYTTQDRIQAFDRLDSIRTLIVKDSVSFQDAARKFSQDRATSVSGGLLADPYSGSSYFEKDQLKPNDYAVIRNMKEGDVSEPFESLDNEGRNGNTVYKIIYLEKIIPSHTATLETDYNQLLETVNNKQAEEAIDNFIKTKQKVTHIFIDPMFRGCDFKYEGWVR